MVPDGTHATCSTHQHTQHTHRQEALDKLLQLDASEVAMSLDNTMGVQFTKLNHELADLVDRYNLVQFTKLNILDEESIGNVLAQVDMAMQYGEDTEVQIPRDAEEGGGEELDN